MKHITYGIFSVAFERPVRPFGFPSGQYLSLCRVEPSKLDEIFTTCTAVRKWSKYNTSGQIGFKFSLLVVKDISLPAVDLMSLHGLRYVFPEITSATTASAPTHNITNDP